MRAMCINVPARTRVNVVMPKQRHSLRIINDEFNFTSFEKCNFLGDFDVFLKFFGFLE